MPSCVLNLSDAGAVTVHVSAAVPTQLSAPVPTQAPPVVTPTKTREPVMSVKPTKSATPQPRSTTSAAAAPTPKATATPTAAATAAPTTTAPAGGAQVNDADPFASAAPPGGHRDGGSGGSGTAGGAGSAGNAKIDAASPRIGPAVSLEGADPKSPNYLLVVPTTIGIIGVGSAAIRALIAQRAVRRAY